MYTAIMNYLMVFISIFSILISNSYCSKIKVEGKARICKLSMKQPVFFLNSEHENEEQCINKLILDVDIDTTAVNVSIFIMLRAI